MTGWRVGFLHGPARMVTDVLKVHDTLVTCAPVISQHASLAALELGDEAIGRVPPSPGRGHRALRCTPRGVRLPEAERVLLRLPAREGYGSAGT
jgi:hypothetical protein